MSSPVKPETFRPFVATANEQIVGIEIQKPLVKGSLWRVRYVVMQSGQRRQILGTGVTYWHAMEAIADKASKMGIGAQTQ